VTGSREGKEKNMRTRKKGIDFYLPARVGRSRGNYFGQKETETSNGKSPQQFFPALRRRGQPTQMGGLGKKKPHVMWVEKWRGSLDWEGATLLKK